MQHYFDANRTEAQVININSVGQIIPLDLELLLIFLSIVGTMAHAAMTSQC